MTASAGGFYLEQFSGTESSPSSAIALESVGADHVQLITDHLSKLFNNAELREDGEPAPILQTKQSAETLLEGASELLGGAMPFGDPATYFGEISVSWHTGRRFLRLACFPEPRPPRLDFGSLDEIGKTQTLINVNATNLADRLEWLQAGLS
jgi:hypothetical protein